MLIPGRWLLSTAPSVSTPHVGEPRQPLSQTQAPATQSPFKLQSEAVAHEAAAAAGASEELASTCRRSNCRWAMPPDFCIIKLPLVTRAGPTDGSIRARCAQRPRRAAGCGSLLSAALWRSSAAQARESGSQLPRSAGAALCRSALPQRFAAIVGCTRRTRRGTALLHSVPRLPGRGIFVKRSLRQQSERESQSVIVGHL